MDSSIDLQQPIIDGGIRSINFFNGRMLTARDLTREQSANREVTRRLGQAVGEGVAYGLEVSKSKSASSTSEFPLVTVTPGLAVNRQGQTLWLRDQTDVALVRKASASAAGVIFTECQPLQAGTYVAGAGVYLLTVAPAETREGRAVTSALNTGGAACNTDAVVSAVQFRLIQIDPPITTTELHDEKHLQNLIAYKCFGVAETQTFVKNPFGSDLPEYGLLDSLRPNPLTDCDVPLGVLYWTLSDGIKFIDMWSARRTLMGRDMPGRSSPIVSDRRAKETEAMVLQFSTQIEDIEVSTLESVVATQHFNYLPPAGLLPVSRESFDGIIVDNFFSGLPHREPEFIDRALTRALLREAINHEPIDLSKGEMVWVYKVWQNERDFKQGMARPFLVFASAYLPYVGTARFDVAHWDYANYGRCENCAV